MSIAKTKHFKRINEFVEGETIVTFLLVDSVSVRQKADGADYIAVRLKDGTGAVDGKIWDDVDKYRDLRAGDVVKVDADVRSYRGRPDMNIRRLRLLQDRDCQEGFDPKCLEEWSKHNLDELWLRLKQAVDRIGSDPLRNLVHTILGAKEEPLRRLPAAKDMHHAWFGGLLEHTVWVVDGCLRLIDNYPELNRDMVIAGAVLHDIGKVDELDGQHAVDYTVDGRLIGHIILGRDILLRHARLVPDFPQDALRHLEHILLSHQGEREWGSPVLPATPEAFLIHLVDNLDAKLRMFLQAMERAPADQPFTEFHHALERRIFLGWQRSREEPEGHRPSP